MSFHRRSVACASCTFDVHETIGEKECLTISNTQRLVDAVLLMKRRDTPTNDYMKEKHEVLYIWYAVRKFSYSPYSSRCANNLDN